MTGEAHLLTPFQLDFYWPAISKELDTVRHTWELWWTKEALRTGVLEGWLHAWAIGGQESISLTVFTQFIHYPSGNKMLRIVLILGKKLDEFFDVAEAAIEKFARDNDCGYLEAHGRRGWERRLPGVKVHGTILTRKVNSIRMQ